MVMGGILRRADRCDGVRALSFWQDGVRPGAFDGTDAAVGAGCVRRAKPGVPGGGAGGAAGELLEAGNGDGPAALPGAGIWSAGGDGFLSAARDRHIADQPEPMVLSILRFTVCVYGLHGGHVDFPDVVRLRDSEAAIVRFAGNYPARRAVCAGEESAAGDCGGGVYAEAEMAVGAGPEIFQRQI